MIELLCAERLARMLQPAPSLPNQHGAIDVLFGIPVEADETIAFADAIAVRGASLSHRIEPDNG
jgi:hypothetical protein